MAFELKLRITAQITRMIAIINTTFIYILSMAPSTEQFSRTKDMCKSVINPLKPRG
jgi:hypothetical protein